MNYPKISLVVLLILLLPPQSKDFAQSRGGAERSAGARIWPSPFPCRIEDKNRDLFVMTLGDVQTPIADGIFDPSTDEVRLKDGRIMKSYYRDSLGVRFFTPINKQFFHLPPSGWCSWYYYYQEIGQLEIQRNAKWIADNLKDYGATYVQIDDGWQGTGHGLGENRDWTTVDKRFPDGMDSLARYIRRLGLKAGLWLAPHGQSNEKVVRANPDFFLLRQDGSSASDTWEGAFLIDPTTAEARDFLKSLFTTLSLWGYDYFKIDGQPIVISEYEKKKPFMKLPSGDHAGLYRGTLQSIRSAIGQERYLLGCWGIPLEGVGFMNGSRTGGDVVLGWSGFKVAVDATMQYYFLHNVAWYCDPDVMLVRSPLSLDQARAWATLQGLTGQGLMASDRLMDLSSERVELLKRVYPAADIRPLDLFPSPQRKRIWDLKISHLGRNYDVVGVFNFKENTPEHVYVNWNELGIPNSTTAHVFDFWSKQYLGCWAGGIALELNPSSCRVMTLVPATENIQLVSTSRHITQGWMDLVELTFDRRRHEYSGKSKVIKGDPYELYFAFPQGENFSVERATADDLPVTISNHQGWAMVRIASPVTREVAWRVRFVKSDFYRYPVQKPRDPSIEIVGLDGANVRWHPQYSLAAGYQISLDGKLLGFSPGTFFPLRNLDLNKEHLVEVRSVWEDGSMSKESEVLKFTLSTLLPREIVLSSLDPIRSTVGWGTLEMNKAVCGKTLSVGGKMFRVGIGTHAASDIEFDLRGLFTSLTAQIGIDDGNEAENGSVEFVVLGDGKELWRSGVMKKGDNAKPLSVKIAGVQKLLLRVTDGGDGIDYDHADWLEAIVSK